jgi:hypothetical protein
MCFPGVIKATYDKDDPSTWKHWQTAEQKSTEEGRMTNPFATEDNRYDELSGRKFSIQTQPGGVWGSSPTEGIDGSKHSGFMRMALMTGQMGARGNMASSHTLQSQHYGPDTVWQAMREIDHKYELADIKKRSQLAPIPGSQGSGRGYSAYSRSGRGAAPSNGLGISTGSMIEQRGSK